MVLVGGCSCGEGFLNAEGCRRQPWRYEAVVM